MPDPHTPGRNVDLSNAPAGDINFDDLFPVEAESLVVAPPQAAPTSGANPPAAAPQPPAPDYFLKGNKTVYKTAEDAIEGINTKDTLIENYRSFLKTKGINPDTLESVNEPQAPAAPASNSPYKYLNNEQKLFDDLARLARTDPAAWGRTLREYNQEVVQAQVAPVLPLLSEVSRQRAIRQVSQEVSDFNSFMGSSSYNETLEKVPLLKQAIQNAENNFEMSETLPQLYQLAYLTSQGLRKPEPVAAPAPVAVAAPQHPARPTTFAPSSLTPPQPSAPPDMRTSAGRKALIQDMESRGILDRNF